jgi:hypothetical protein
MTVVYHDAMLCFVFVKQPAVMFHMIAHSRTVTAK